VYKKVNNSKCQLESYTHPVPNKAANSKFELNKFNFSNLKPYCHSDTCSDSDDVIDSVTSTLSHDSDSDTSISSDDVTDDVGDVTDDVTSSYDFYSDSDTNMSHDFYSDSNSLSTTSTTIASLSSSTVGSSHSDIEKASVAEQSDLKVTYTVTELLPVAKSVQARFQTSVYLEPRSDGDLLFHEKGTSKHFSYLTRQVLQSWHTSKGNFYTNERASIDRILGKVKNCSGFSNKRNDH
jgi:hypothetical protein